MALGVLLRRAGRRDRIRLEARQPAVDAVRAARASANALRLLARPPVALGMAAVSVFFMGQFTLFTYLRPFLETVTHAGTVTLSLLLLVIGVAGFAGTFLIGGVLERGSTGHSWPRRH